MPLPVVTAQDLHLARLSPRLRRTLAHRARQAARREYAPILAADRAAFGAANRAYRTEAQSVRGATSMVQDSLADALQSLQGSGLRGRYLRQVRNEFTSRQGDAAASIPFLLADATSDRSEAILDARTQLISDRAQMQSSAASGFNQLLKEARTSASSILKARAEENPGNELKVSPRALRIGLMAASAGYQAVLRDVGKRARDGTIVQVPRTDADWRAFALTVAKTEGVDPVDAAKAVEILRRRIQQQVRKGNLRPLGIVFQNMAE